MRRKQWVLDVLHIGKEANDIDTVQAGFVDSQDQVLLTYERDPWETLQPILAEVPVRLIMEKTGYSRSMAYALHKGDRRPSRQRLESLSGVLAEHCRRRLVGLGYLNSPVDDRMAVAVYGKVLEKWDD